MITVLPTLHSIIMMMPGLIQAGSFSQLGPGNPTDRKIWLTMPSRPLSSSRNSAPTATAGVMLGR